MGCLPSTSWCRIFSIHRISQFAWIKSPCFFIFLANPTCFPHVSWWMSQFLCRPAMICLFKGFWDPSSEAMTLSSVAAQLLYIGSTWFVSPVITCYNMLLVGGVEHLDYVPYIGNFIIPTDFHIFQRGWNHQPGYNLVSNVSPTINLPFGDGSYKPFIIYEISGMVHSWVYHIGIEDLRSPGYHRPLTERDASDAPPNRPPINIQP